VRDNSGNKRSIPRKESVVPGKERPIPRKENSIPRKERRIPGNRNSIPGNKRPVPGNELSIPGNALPVPGNRQLPPWYVFAVVILRSKNGAKVREGLHTGKVKKEGILDDRMNLCSGVFRVICQKGYRLF
jgi:hypothetical protein